MSFEIPQLRPEEMALGMTFFQRFLKKVRIDREGRVVHVDWVFEFPTEEMARAFVEVARQQLGGGDGEGEG